MPWIIAALPAAAVLIVLFVLLTDGRYFGKRLMRWVYDRFGPAIYRVQSPSARWDALAEELHLTGEESLLDVGTATGGLPLALAARPGFSGRVVGVDWSPPMIEAAREQAQRRGLQERASFRVVDVREGLPFSDGEYDLVCCLGLLETLPHPERVLAELARVLAPGGALVLSLYRGVLSLDVALIDKPDKSRII